MAYEEAKQTKTPRSVSDCGAASNRLLLAGIADHLHIGYFHVTVLGVFLHGTRVAGTLLGIFFKVVHLSVRHNACNGYSMPDVFGQRHLTAPHFPRASIVCGELELICTVPLREAAGHSPHVGLGFRLAVRILRDN